MNLSWLVLRVTLTVSCCYGSDILMITMGISKSHKMPFVELGNGLAKKGHNITLISAFPEKERSPYIQEITPPGFVSYIENITSVDVFGARLRNKFPVTLTDGFHIVVEICNRLLSDPETQMLLHSERHFDLIVIDSISFGCCFGFAHHFKAPYIYLHMVASFSEPLSLAGNPAPFSFTPHYLMHYSDNMNLWERVNNAAYHIVTTTVLSTINIFTDQILRQHWPDIPSISSMSKNVSLILMYGHPVITYSRTYLPNVKEVGCIQCKPAKPLPQELEDFVMSNGDAGFIYISMGTLVRTTTMPEQLRQLFVRVFAQLPYRVLWKWEAGNGSMSDLSPNVRLSRWLPQQDILGHPKIRAFISHCGINSLFETVYHGVPMITLPVFGDQIFNARKAEIEGYALNMELRYLTEKKLLKAINQVIHDPRFYDNVIKLSSILRDRPETPLNSAIFWTEYVIRHRGANHLQSPSKDMNLFQYCSIDVLLIYLFVFVFIIYILLKIVAVLKFLIVWLINRKNCKMAPTAVQLQTGSVKKAKLN